MTPDIQTDFLVVGAGPAGAGLACFLGQNNLKGMMIASAPSTADTPRAHLVNPFALECLRDISVEDDCMRMSMAPELIGAFRYSRSLLGEEYANVHHWEGNPEVAAKVKLYTPSRWVDLPQSLMEPILIRYASLHGFTARFSTRLLSVEKDQSTGRWICTVMDDVHNDTYRIRTKFVFGADGGRSQVARSTSAKFTSLPSQGIACNVLFRADLTNFMNERHAQLHTIINPSASTRFGIGPIIRVIRPWNEWMIGSMQPGMARDQDPFKDITPDDPELNAFVRRSLGLDLNPLTKDIPVTIHRIDAWTINDSVADSFKPADNVFLLGDAAHRHPPMYGLGSNTCIQDAYNLAWKVAYVARGHAGSGLLDSYNAERRPVGAQLVRQANEGLPDHFNVWRSLGMTAATVEERVRVHEELTQASEAGEAARRKLHEALKRKEREGKSLGLCMNQWYVSDAVYLDDEPEPRPQLEGDPITEVQVSTYPGSRLPHAWLDVPLRRKPISTHDLAGKGAFCVFTSYGGDAWQDAARKISESTGIPINRYKIGLGLEWQDIYREWYHRRGVEDSGCVLVRPDRFVAWRSVKVVGDCEGKLSKVLNKILCRG